MPQVLRKSTTTFSLSLFFFFLQKKGHKVLFCSYWADYLPMPLSLGSDWPHRCCCTKKKRWPFSNFINSMVLKCPPKCISLFAFTFYVKSKTCLSLLGRRVKVSLHTFVVFPPARFSWSRLIHVVCDVRSINKPCHPWTIHGLHTRPSLHPDGHIHTPSPQPKGNLCLSHILALLSLWGLLWACLIIQLLTQLKP